MILLSVSHSHWAVTRRRYQIAIIVVAFVFIFVLKIRYNILLNIIVLSVEGDEEPGALDYVLR